MSSSLGVRHPSPFSTQEMSRELKAVWDEHSQHLLWSGACEAKRLDERRQGKNVSGSDTRDNKSVTQTKARMDTVGLSVS